MTAAPDSKKPKWLPGEKDSKENVAKWLKEWFPDKEYHKTFLKQDIDGEELRTLTDDEFEKLGVTLGDKKKIRRSVAPAGGAAGAAAAPAAVLTVTKDDLSLCNCKALVPGDDDCPIYKQADIKRCLEVCMAQIEEELGKNTSETGGYRVPPLMLSRCARGGKTTMLCRLFEEIKKKGWFPIFVSFNGDGAEAITKLARETDYKETLLRGIAWNMMDESARGKVGGKQSFQCPETSIDDAIKGKDKRVVLLVDEMNALIDPDKTDHAKEETQEIGDFLRKKFLDPKGRYLCFTSHMPVGAHASAVIGYGTSARRTLSASMPQVTIKTKMDDEGLMQLKNMHEKVKNLTGGEAAYYSCVPSIIYSEFVTRELYPKRRFARVVPGTKPTADLAEDFLFEFFEGNRARGSMRAFDTFTLATEDTGTWVLCYAREMSEYLKTVENAFAEIARMLSKLPDHAHMPDTGKAWEIIVTVATVMRCIEAKFTKTRNDVLSIPGVDGAPKEVIVKELGLQITDAAKAIKWWRMESKSTYPYVAVLYPQCRNFAEVDKLVVYQKSKGSKLVVTGIQDKHARAYPKKDFAVDGANAKAVLMCGHPPEACQGNAKCVTWTFLDKGQVGAFLGKSLEIIMPMGKW
eukprot:TRINITY_DN21678_c0_g1_i6.p1 TRINITY_DN21678_c0_g1~~TRINITY_DN21678_c0_g1_i6.p1  ORF type:complete len:652 (+),score=213.19 TRINITY_DN21678_c0_g1_i6:61-1956(+)